MDTDDCECISGCLCWLFLILGLIVVTPIFILPYASPSAPIFSINLFDNQDLNMTRVADDHSAANLSINFDLKLENINSVIGLYYTDPLELTFSYFPNISMNMVMLAEYKVDKFYQGKEKTRHVRDMVETNGYPTVLEGTDIIAFRVDVVATYKYKKAGTKRHTVAWGCLVGINYTTNKKIQTGYIQMVEPGLDSKLEPPRYPIDRY